VLLKGGSTSLAVLRYFPNTSINCEKLQRRPEYQKHKITTTDKCQKASHKAAPEAGKLNITKKYNFSGFHSSECSECDFWVVTSHSILWRVCPMRELLSRKNLETCEQQ
jgi:hypothetical protein